MIRLPHDLTVQGAYGKKQAPDGAILRSLSVTGGLQASIEIPYGDQGAAA